MRVPWTSWGRTLWGWAAALDPSGPASSLGLWTQSPELVGPGGCSGPGARSGDWEPWTPDSRHAGQAGRPDPDPAMLGSGAALIPPCRTAGNLVDPSTQAGL
ncbi:hypothetical protein UY3_05675 [Chelonia mydas]|uniref:Secreted protein n=1 Tax=Chelonia mydas TaxID=8469 RepID=M7BIX2_CHEMY|nr:hypothetical protein UY3_05675 [Chelonia mydas]